MKQRKVQSAKCKVFLTAFIYAFAICILPYALFAQTNDLNKIADGGYLGEWLISDQFPSEIDAGAWENFNRFNLENLPAKNWLAPFGGVNIKPQTGTFKAQTNTQPDLNPKSQIPNSKSGEPLPEVGAQSNSQTFADAKKISWRELSEPNAVLDFYEIFGAKQIGTAYAASYINSPNNQLRYLETDGFLGKIWLNGAEIYDGFSLNVKKVVAANFSRGENVLLVRASGVSGDYWRKNGGWTAMIKIWKSETAANDSAAFKPSGADGTINYLEGFHVDPVYLHDQRGYAKITLSNTAQYLRSLRSDPRYGVYLSEIDYLKPYLDTNPQDREFLRETVKNRRVGAGGAYNQFNENTIGGEAIIRNILYGQSMHNALLGRKSESLALWDVFGHAPQISQIAAKSGFIGIVWSKKIQGFQPFFYDYALDGSRLLHRRVDYAYSFSGFGSGKNYTFDNFRKMTERKYEEARSFNSATDLRINAADFTPPWTNLAGNVETLENQKPKIRVSGQAQDFYFRELNKEIAEGKVKPPVSSRDKLFFHVGVSMARSDLKIGQRVSENITLTAEKFGTIAYFLGAKYPDLALDKAWRQIFFGSHHDAITGTPSDNAFLDLVYGYREAYELSKDALDDSLKFISGQINTQSANSNDKRRIPIIVFNSLNWARTDVVKAKIEIQPGAFDLEIKDAAGKPVEKSLTSANPMNRFGSQVFEIEFVAENVPSLGYKTFYVEPVQTAKLDPIADNKNPEKQTYFASKAPAIENEFYKITIDETRGGAITSVYDKKANREIIDVSKKHFGNEIGVLSEELNRKNVVYPAWELWTTGKKTFSSETKATFTSGNIGNTQVLKINGILPNKTAFVQTITLYKGVKRIDFKTELIDYKGKDELFVVNFPLNLTGGALVTEDRFGTVVRNSSKGFLDFRTNTDKLISGAPVYSANNWAEYGSTYNLNFVNAKNSVVSSVAFKPAALVRPHGANFEILTETIVGNLIKRGVSVTPFYDDNDAPRRSKLSIEDSTMPKNLNDDVAYHNFRIALGGEKENSYSAKLLKQISAETRAKFDARLQKNGYAFLFLYDAEIPKDYPKMPTLLIAANDAESYKIAVEKLILPIQKGSADNRLAVFQNDEARQTYENINIFAVDLPIETFAVETNPNSELPKVPDYGVALINNGTAGVSLENGSVLTLFLTHTAPFPGVNLPFEFTPEHKTHVFSYSLYPHEKDWREAGTVKAGYDANNPLIAIQTDVHNGKLPNRYSFLLTDAKAILSTLKLGGNPLADFRQPANARPLIARFYEPEGQWNSEFAHFRFHAAKGIFKTDLLENGDESYSNDQNSLKQTFIAADGRRVDEDCCTNFQIELNPFEIQTYKIFAVNSSVANSPVVGAAAEKIQPVFSRYWTHNTGAAPIGNDAVKVSLRLLEQQGELSTFSYDDKYNQGGTTTVGVRVSVVNNYQDRRISGEVKLDVPPDWRIVPATLKYDIAPNGSFTQDVAVITFPIKKDLEWKRASGLVKAGIEHDGQMFQDVLNLGKTLKLEWTTEQTTDETLIKIKNPHRQIIEGSVALITPPEMWFFRKTESPREIGFAVQPESETVLRFKTGIFPAGTWRIARLAYNGNVEYLNAGK